MQESDSKVIRGWCLAMIGFCIPIVAVACVLGGVVFVVGRVAFPPRRDATIADYPVILAIKQERLAHFPRAIPAEAKGVRFIAEGFFESFPVPDKYVELRFVLPPAAIEALCESTRRMASRASTDDAVANRLRTADDQDRTTPVPAGFTTHSFNDENSMPERTVSINPSTGEVVYRLYET